MTFNAPQILPWLLLALLPIVIHLLNRLRYKTVKWAAMMFLLKANQSSTRNARLRHWLILASRCLLLFFFLFAVARPVIGGWLGSALAGAPETVILALDRSASMEQQDPRQNRSKREIAIDLFSQAATELGTDSRYVLIEHVLRDPVTIAGPDSLKDIDLTAATDTAADIPALLRSAFDYLQRNGGGRAEIWLASDCQRSNWRPDSREWESLASKLQSLGMEISIRLIALPLAPDRNLSVAVNQLNRLADAKEVRLKVQVNSATEKTPEFQLAFITNERRTPVTQEMARPELRFNQRLPIIGDVEADGWGKVELQADQNPNDNQHYFVFANAEPARAMVIATRPATKRVCNLAVVPDGRLRFVENIALPDAGSTGFGSTSMIFWQGGEPDARTASNLTAFVEAGGQLFCFPSAEVNVSGPFGLNWAGIDNTDQETGFDVERWEEDEGPLARSADGINLKVAELNVRRRQQVQVDENWQTLAEFDDKTPLFLRRIVGQGRVYAFTTLPEKEWSLLADGLVLVPSVLRVLDQGAGRLQRVRSAVCGEWLPGDTINWQAVHSAEAPDPRWTAGVYVSDDGNSSKVALNRPAREDSPERLKVEEATALFGDLDVTALDQKEAEGGKTIVTELWRWFLYLALFFMLVEGLLLLLDRRPAKRDGAFTPTTAEGFQAS